MTTTEMQNLYLTEEFNDIKRFKYLLTMGYEEFKI
jgi:hypothetical protein